MDTESKAAIEYLEDEFNLLWEKHGVIKPWIDDTLLYYVPYGHKGFFSLRETDHIHYEGYLVERPGICIDDLYEGPPLEG